MSEIVEEAPGCVKSVISPSVGSVDSKVRVTLSKSGGALRRILKYADTLFSSVSLDGRVM